MGRAKHIDVVLGRSWHVDSIHLIFVLHAHSSDSSVCFSVHSRLQIILCISGLPAIFATLHVSVSETSHLWDDTGRVLLSLHISSYQIVQIPDRGLLLTDRGGVGVFSVPHSVKG